MNAFLVGFAAVLAVLHPWVALAVVLAVITVLVLLIARACAVRLRLFLLLPSARWTP